VSPFVSQRKSYRYPTHQRLLCARPQGVTAVTCSQPSLVLPHRILAGLCVKMGCSGDLSRAGLVWGPGLDCMSGWLCGLLEVSSGVVAA
jgi:hypothetical protein